MYSEEWSVGYAPKFLARVKRKRQAAEANEKRVATLAARIGAPVTAQEISRIEAMKGEPTADMHIRQIIETVAANHGVTYDQVVGRARFKNITQARWAAIHAVHALKPHLSSPHIARYFNRDHTSILHALGKLGKKKEEA